MSDERREARGLGVLGERDEQVGRAGERHLHEDDVEALERVAPRILVEELRDRRQLPAEPQVDPGALAKLLRPLRDERLARLVGRHVRGDVRRREERPRPVAGGGQTELGALVHRLRAVVAGGDDVAVEVDEPA